jgi:hypothetical protein
VTRECGEDGLVVGRAGPLLGAQEAAGRLPGGGTWLSAADRGRSGVGVFRTIDVHEDPCAATALSGGGVGLKLLSYYHNIRHGVPVGSGGPPVAERGMVCA